MQVRGDKPHLWTGTLSWAGVTPRLTTDTSLSAGRAWSRRLPAPAQGSLNCGREKIPSNRPPAFCSAAGARFCKQGGL